MRKAKDSMEGYEIGPNGLGEVPMVVYYRIRLHERANRMSTRMSLILSSDLEISELCW